MSRPAHQLAETRARLAGRWRAAQSGWRDPVAVRFGEEHLEPLLALIQSAGNTMADACAELGRAAEAAESFLPRP